MILKGKKIQKHRRDSLIKRNKIAIFETAIMETRRIKENKDKWMFKHYILNPISD